MYGAAPYAGSLYGGEPEWLSLAFQAELLPSGWKVGLTNPSWTALLTGPSWMATAGG